VLFAAVNKYILILKWEWELPDRNGSKWKILSAFPLTCSQYKLYYYYIAN